MRPHPSLRSVGALLAVTALTLAACSGDDSAGVSDPPAVTSDVTAGETDDDTGTPDGDAPDDGSPDSDESDRPEPGQSPEELDDAIRSIGGEGGGTVTVNGIEYVVEAEYCVDVRGDFLIDGPARGSDGSPAWVAASHSFISRSEMAGTLDPAALDQIFPPGSDVAGDVQVVVAVGKTERFATVNNQPAWSVTTGAGLFPVGEVTFDYADGVLEGSGSAVDSSGIARAPDDPAPIEFRLECS